MTHFLENINIKKKKKSVRLKWGHVSLVALL